MQTKCIVSKLLFNDGEELTVLPNDIVVFVGSNNCGKSQSLKDIYNAFAEVEDGILVKKAHFDTQGAEQIADLVKRVSVYDSKRSEYRGYGFHFGSSLVDSFKNHQNGYLGRHFFTDFFIKKIDTRDRLQQCDPTEQVDRDAPKMHPFHYLVTNGLLRSQIDKCFFEAFGEHLQLDRYFGRNVFMRVGDEIKRKEGNNVSPDAEFDHVCEVLDKYPKLHEQGDGMVGFVGVLLSLIIENYSLFLIDEPESFLHPPQARILGAEIPVLLGDRQAFIATHSEHMLKGLLDAAHDRIKVVRITRNGKSNKFSVINSDDISRIWKDTLLRQSNVLQGLFYDSMAVCESDSDCQFYSSIKAYLKEQQHKRDNTFFVYSSTKSRMKVIVEALKPLDVTFRVIADVDLLREQNDLRLLYEACGGSWDDLEGNYKKFIDALKDEKNTIKKEALKILFARTIDENGIDEYDLIALKKLKKKVTLDYKWKALKAKGISAVPDDVLTYFNEIQQSLKSHHILLVPNGELEGFVNVDGHGPKWVANVFDKYPDYGDAVYEDARQFVAGWGI